MTTNLFLTELAKRLKLKNFRGVFMRDELSSITPMTHESGIMNFDKSDQSGSHWVAWYVDESRPEKRAEKYYYFDSYGTAVPDELRRYLSRDHLGASASNLKKIMRSDFMIQGINTDICGELCLAFIYLMDYTDLSYKEIINHLNPGGSALP